MKYLLPIIFCTILFTANAETIYTQTENGNTVYTDTAPAEGSVVEVQQTSSAPSINQPQPKTASPLPEMEIHVPYKTFAIVSPQDQDTLQNERDFTVTVKLDPELQKGDKIQLFVDGVRYGEPKESVTLPVGQLERGTHQISAAIIGENKTIIKQSNAITIYVHYAALGTGLGPIK